MEENKEVFYSLNTEKNSIEENKNQYLNNFDNKNIDKQSTKNYNKEINGEFNLAISIYLFTEKLKEKVEIFGEENCKELINVKKKENQYFWYYLESIKIKNDNFLEKDITNNLEDVREKLRNLFKLKNKIFSEKKKSFCTCFYCPIVNQIEKYCFKKKMGKKFTEINNEVNLEFNSFFLNHYGILINLKNLKIITEIIQNFDLNNIKNILSVYNNIHENDLIDKYIDKIKQIDEIVIIYIKKEWEFLINCLVNIIEHKNDI
jgi:hypothetical protein